MPRDRRCARGPSPRPFLAIPIVAPAACVVSVTLTACSSATPDTGGSGSDAVTTLCGRNPPPRLCRSLQCVGDTWESIPVADGLPCQPTGTYPTPYECIAGSCKQKHTADILP